MDEEDKTTYNMVMPLVCGKSEGGAYDDLSFVAGVEYSEINHTLQTLRLLGINTHQRYVRPGIIRQLDLLVMHLGWSMKIAGVDPNSTEITWVHAEFTMLEKED